MSSLWWNQNNAQGIKFGYFTNATKTWLFTKDNFTSRTAAVYANPGVRVTSEGRLYLAVALSTDEYSYAFVASEV